MEYNDAMFANLYLERILNEVGELTKLKLMNETRILFLEKVNAEQAKQIEALAAQVERKTSKVTKLREAQDTF